MIQYKKYKDSGISWIGKIPEHWEVTCIKRIANVYTGTTPSTNVKKYFNSKDINWYTPADFSEENLYLDKSNRFLSQTLLDEKIIRLYPAKCVLLIGIGGTLGKIGYSNKECYSNQQINAIIFNNKLNSLYYAYSLQPIKPYIWANANTATMPILNQSATKNIFVAIPSVEEQQQIADYLDWKCAEVDRIVGVREKQIILLKELRSSVISRAVTRGLDPNVPLKDSGIDWIGQIPKHWETGAYKRCMKINNGKDYKNIVELDGFPVIGSGGQFSYASNFMYDGEVVFLGRKGTIDKPIYFNGKFWAVDTMFYSVPNKRSFCKFMYYQAMMFPFDKYSTSTALPSMTQNDLGNNHISIPFLSEQQQIANYLDEKTAEIDNTIEKYKMQINKLKEYRQALITEVVTGKIDVRDVKIPINQNE